MRSILWYYKEVKFRSLFVLILKIILLTESDALEECDIFHYDWTKNLGKIIVFVNQVIVS